MTYGVKNVSALFRAHNQTRQASVPVGDEFIVSSTSECKPHPNGGVLVNRVYVYGDLRTVGYLSEGQHNDVALRNATSMLSEGWQTPTNRSFASCVDDAIYGIVEGRVALYHKASYSGTTTSDAEETRIFGMRLVP